MHLNVTITQPAAHGHQGAQEYTYIEGKQGNAGAEQKDLSLAPIENSRIILKCQFLKLPDQANTCTIHIIALEEWHNSCSLWSCTDQG